MTGPKLAEHAGAAVELWQHLRSLQRGTADIVLNGENLTISDIVAVARHAVPSSISTDGELADRLARSVDVLNGYLCEDNIVYGVNTGFGGSADVRTNELLDLQISLLQHTQSAIVPSWDKDPTANSERNPCQVMPPAWVRGAMLARANQNLRGHSAVRLEVLQALMAMLEKDIIPMVPLRGTISASGDLMPLSYIAGALTGNPDVYVQVGQGRNVRVMPAPDALREYGLSPSGLGPKEGLGLINGTAPSVSVGSLVLYDAQLLACLSQLCTAFASEALCGNVEWSTPFIHAIRPHAGQVEAAGNIRAALRGSDLVQGLDSRRRKGEGLWQDRYSTRTAPQWIGPYLEDLLLAQRQLEVELNSTSDNPVVDANAATTAGAATGEVYSGGNFQAVTVTSAMDKARMALQMIGRLIFTQVSELIDPTTNNGLEANLNASDRENFTMKGVDVNMAAYMAELAALAHPVSSHVVSAEMRNQGINSLALVSARRTMEAVEILRYMFACHLYVMCQAVDMRATHQFFLNKLRSEVLAGETEKGAFHGLDLSKDELNQMAEKTFPVIKETWWHWNSGSWKDRIPPVVEAVMGPATRALVEMRPDASVSQLETLQAQFSSTLTATAESVFYPSVVMTPAAVAMRMGDGTAPLYAWVRSRLDVPTHRGMDDDPLYTMRNGKPSDGKRTIGSWIGMVYESLRGDMMNTVMECAGGMHRAPRSEAEYDALVKEMKGYYHLNGNGIKN